MTTRDLLGLFNIYDISFMMQDCENQAVDGRAVLEKASEQAQISDDVRFSTWSATAPICFGSRAQETDVYSVC
jgi:hypothetical protein